MSIHETALLALIDDLLAGRLDFEDFSSSFYDSYLETLPPVALSEAQAAFYSAVHARLDWTAVEVDEESRGHGWITAAEFLVWLKALRDAYTPGTTSAA